MLGDHERLADLLNDAGADAVAVSTSTGVAQFPSIQVMVEANLRGWLPVMGVSLTEDEIGRILEEAENVLGSNVTADGRVAFELQAHVVTARKP